VLTILPLNLLDNNCNFLAILLHSYLNAFFISPSLLDLYLSKDLSTHLPTLYADFNYNIDLN